MAAAGAAGEAAGGEAGFGVAEFGVVPVRGAGVELRFFLAMKG